jgi:hypothetical protein
MYKKWTQAEKDHLREHYAMAFLDELMAALSRSGKAIQLQAQRMGLKKSPAFFSERCNGRQTSGKFKPGHATWNKGKKGIDIGGKISQFKAGNTPHNAAPVGTIVKAKQPDRGEAYYWKIKIADPNRWQFLHRKNWEDAHGPISPGFVVCFRDGNSDNCALENLELVGRGELTTRNRWPGWRDVPDELKPAITLRNQLKTALRRPRNDKTLHSQ